MKTRVFSFGFTESEDKQTGKSVLIQHHRSELRTCSSFEKPAHWLSFHVPMRKVRKPLKPEKFIAYSEELTLENKQIKDLKKHRALLPVKLRQLIIYNLPENDEDEEDDEDGEE
jgi:hypothetical protein